MSDEIKCPNCGQEFLEVNGDVLVCPNCKKKYKNPYNKILDNSIKNIIENDIKLEEIKETQETPSRELEKKEEPVVVQNKENPKDDKIFPIKEINGSKNNAPNGNLFDTFNAYFMEFFSFKQYKRIPLALAIVAGILLSPFLLATIALLIAIYVLNFVYKLISSPADFLIQTFNTESDSIPVKVVVYIVGYPFVFIFKVLLSMFSIIFFVYYFLLNIFGYVYSLGAMKFQPFLYEASKDCGFKLSKKASKRTISIIMIVCIFVGAIYLGIGIAKIIDVAVDNNSYTSSTKNSTNNTNVINKTTDFERNLTLSSGTSRAVQYNVDVETAGSYYLKINGNDNHAYIYVYIDDTLVFSTTQYSYTSTSYLSTGSHVVKIKYANNINTNDAISFKIYF